MGQTLQAVVTILTIIGMSFGAFFFFEGRYSKSDEIKVLKNQLEALSQELLKANSNRKSLITGISIMNPEIIEYGERRVLPDGVVTDEIKRTVALKNRAAVFISAYASATQKIDEKEVDEKYAKVEVKLTLDGKEVAREHSGIRGMKKVEIAASATHVTVLNAGTHQLRATGVYQGIVFTPNPKIRLSYVIVEENVSN